MRNHHHLTLLTSAFVSIFALGACSSPPPRPADSGKRPFADPNLYAASEEQTAQALKTMEDIEREIAASQTFDPAEREQRLRSLGSRLERLVTQAQGSRFHNKALYLLAHWRFTFRDDGSGVGEALDALDALPTPPLKQLGKSLRVLHYSRQGRLVQARTVAEKLVADIPQFAGLLDLVALHEGIGKPAPPTAGRGLDDRTIDPLPGSDRPLLLVIANAWNPETRHVLGRFHAQVEGRCRLALWVADGTPDTLRQGLPAGVVGMYARTKAEADGWLGKWITPDSTLAVLIAPDRTLTGVGVRPGDLGRLLP